MPATDLARRRERLGLLFAALCAVNGGFVPAVAKLTTAAADAAFVATSAAVVAGLCATLVLAGRGELRRLVAPDLAPRLALVGTLGTAAAYALFFAGTARATAIEAALCLQIEPAYALVAAWLVLGHRPTARRLGATLLLLAGITLAVGTEGLRGSSGVWLLLATPLCWQASHLVVLRSLPGADAFLLAAARFVYGGAVLLAGWIATGGPDRMPSPAALVALLPWLVLQGAVLTYLGTLLWYHSVLRLDLARTTAIVVPAIPLLSFVASFLVLGEVATPRQWAGLALVASGILLFVTAPAAVPAAPRVARPAVPV